MQSKGNSFLSKNIVLCLCYDTVDIIMDYSKIVCLSHFLIVRKVFGWALRATMRYVIELTSARLAQLVMPTITIILAGNFISGKIVLRVVTDCYCPTPTTTLCPVFTTPALSIMLHEITYPTAYHIHVLRIRSQYFIQRGFKNIWELLLNGTARH